MYLKLDMYTRLIKWTLVIIHIGLEGLAEAGAEKISGCVAGFHCIRPYFDHSHHIACII